MRSDTITLINDGTIVNFATTSGLAAERTAIPSPGTGELFYQTDTVAGLYTYDGASWNLSLDGALLGANNGIATLDGSGDVPDAQISSSSVTQHEAALSIGGGQVSSAVANATNAGNADTLDSIDSSAFLRSNVADTKSGGTLTFNDNINLVFGNGTDAEFFWDGTNMYTDINFGANWYLRDGNSTNALRFTFDIDNGAFTASGNITAYSDSRIKKDIELIDHAMQKVMALNGYTFARTDTNDDTRQTGVIAQEVLKVLPEAVVESDEGMLSVAYGNMVGLLINAMKEQQGTISALTARVEELEAK